MIPALILASLFTAAMPAAHAAEEPGFCKSICASERQACRATARKASGNDELLQRGTAEKNPFASTAGTLQGQTEQMRAADNASFHKRQAERYGVCEDQYLHCTRACGKPPVPARGS